jgi:hypothetical protein
MELGRSLLGKWMLFDMFRENLVAPRKDSVEAKTLARTDKSSSGKALALGT